MSKKKEVEKPQDQMANLQKDLEAFRKSLIGMSKEELEKLEKDVLKEQDENNDLVQNKTFKMPAKNYVECANAVRRTLSKMKVQWQLALGLKTMYEYFNPEERPVEIAYPVLDSVLRTLVSCQYEGYEAWCDVVTISNYFEPIRAEYTAIGESTYTLAEKHSAIVQNLDLHNEAKSASEETEAKE